MNDITASLGSLYHPVKAFVVFKKGGTARDIYVESFDMDREGYPINAHPLTVRESTALAKALDTGGELKRNFLKPAGIMPQNVLYLNSEHNGYVIWHTPQQRVNLYFSDSLSISNGRASVPPLLWKATKEALHIYALKQAEPVSIESTIYHAPFFNVYNDGKVCMGNVKVSIPTDCLLEEFMELWQQYFFNSYFTHLLNNHIPVKGNIVQLWQGLVNSRKKFPAKSLKENGLTLKKHITMNDLTSIHFAHNSLINPVNPISVNLIGCGGTGSQMLTALAKMNHALIRLGHTGLQVTVYDNDRVTTANQGRQLFADSEVGLYKAVCLVNRINRFFGTNWKAVPKLFTSVSLRHFPENGSANIYITCVDTVAARFDIAEAIGKLAYLRIRHREQPLYWMDFGNGRDTGQMILATARSIEQPPSKKYKTVADLPMITDEYAQLLAEAETDDTPSCSLAEALAKQDLFINPTLANEGASLLWQLFREGFTASRGFFVNLKTFRTQPILINA